MMWISIGQIEINQGETLKVCLCHHSQNSQNDLCEKLLKSLLFLTQFLKCQKIFLFNVSLHVPQLQA